MLSIAQRSASVRDLLSMHSAILDELKQRGVVRSQNNPTGDYAEWLCADKLRLTLEMNSAKGFDATDSQGIRYQIKGRRITPKNRSTQLGVIRNYYEKNFDFLLGIIFDQDWQVVRAAKIPHKLVEELATFREYQNGFIMQLNASVLTQKVKDVTDQLRD